MNHFVIATLQHVYHNMHNEYVEINNISIRYLPMVQVYNLAHLHSALAPGSRTLEPPFHCHSTACVLQMHNEYVGINNLSFRYLPMVLVYDLAHLHSALAPGSWTLEPPFHCHSTTCVLQNAQ